MIIGILSAMAYSSLIDMIFTSRAKETAQTIRTFAERALMEGKRQNKEVELSLNGGSIKYETKEVGDAEPSIASAALSNGFSRPSSAPTCINASGSSLVSFNDGAKSRIVIGISRIATEAGGEEGYFAACDAKNYCAAAVKVKTKNSFIACIKKPNSAWEALL